MGNRKLYRMIAAMVACPKKVLNFKSFPSGTLHLSLYCHIQEKTFLYDMADIDSFEAAVEKDWGHLLTLEVGVTATPMADFSLPPLPSLASFI